MTFHWDIGIPTASAYDADGFLGIQVDAFGDGAGCPMGEIHTPFGFISRPRDPVLGADGSPDPTQSGQVLHCWDGGRLHVIPSQDPRWVSKLPQVKAGGSCLYGATGSFVLIDGATGSQFYYVPYGGDPPTKSHSISINVDGDPFISIIHGDGMAVMMNAGGITIKSKGGTSYVSIKDGEIDVVGPQINLFGAVSAGDATATPLALAIPTVAALEAISTGIKALAKWVDATNIALGTIPTFISPAKDTYATASTVVGSALEVLDAALDAEAALVPTKKTMGA